MEHFVFSMPDEKLSFECIVWFKPLNSHGHVIGIIYYLCFADGRTEALKTLSLNLYSL